MSDTAANKPSEISEMSHLDAAREAFKATGGAITYGDDAAPPPSTEKPAEKPAEKKAEPRRSLAADVFKSDEAPAEKPAEKPADTAPEDVFKGLNAPDEKAKFKPDWDKARGIAEQHRKEAAEAKAKITELESRLKGTTPPEADAATKARLAELEEQNKSFSERLKVFDIQGHPDFQREFIAPKKQATATVEAILKDEGVTADIASLLALKGKAFYQEASKIAEQLTTFNQPVFAAELRKIQQLDSQADEAIKNVDTYREQKTKEFAARTRSTFDAVGKSFDGTFLPVNLGDKATDADKAAAAEYNKALAERGKTAEQYAFGRLDEKGAAELAHKAASYDFVMKQAIPRVVSAYETEVTRLSTELARVKAELDGVTAQKPGVRRTGGDAVGSDGGEAPNYETMSNREAAKHIRFGPAQ